MVPENVNPNMLRTPFDKSRKLQLGHGCRAINMGVSQKQKKEEKNKKMTGMSVVLLG